METSIFDMYREYISKKCGKEMSQIISEFSESIKHLDNATGLAVKLIKSDRSYTEEQKISLLYDISMEYPKSAFRLVTGFYSPLAIPFAQKVITETEESFLLEKKPDLAYYVGYLVDDEILMDKARVPFVDLDCTEAYLFGRTYGDKLLKAYAREECIRSHFPE